MTEHATAYAGSIPAQYDSKLGQMFFEPYARDLARRLPPDASRVLEIAAGTGIASRALLSQLAATASLTVTDLQSGMLVLASEKVGHDPRVDIQQADALSLPFADRQYDVVACQFGVMFFPETSTALSEARRVLTPDGVFLLNTWGTLADNPIAGIVHEEVLRAAPDSPPTFLTIPFGMHDADALTERLHVAGFSNVQWVVVDLVGESPSAHAAAMGVICGTPLFTQLQERGIDPRGLVDAVAARLAREGGFAPMRLPMRALVFRAQ